MFLTDKYADVAARYKSWLQMQNVGKYIPDLTLDYLNRAKDAIWGKPVRGWDYLTVDYVPLALGGSTGLEITFPADCGKVLAVYVDNNADHRPDIYYYFAGKIATGMQFISSFDKATGYTWKAKFYYQPTGTPYVRYQQKVADFTGTGDEYCPFPGNLLLLEAQRIRCLEKGLLKEWQALQADYQDQLKDFTQQHQGNNEEQVIEINDMNGLPVSIPEYGLASGTRNRQMFGRKNDFDYYRGN